MKNSILSVSIASLLLLVCQIGCDNNNLLCGEQGCNMVGKLLTNQGDQVEGIPLEIRRTSDQKTVGTTTSSRYGFFTLSGISAADLVAPEGADFPEISVCTTQSDKTVFCFKPAPLDSTLCEISPMEVTNAPFCGGGLLYGETNNTNLGDPVGALNRDGLWVYSDRYTVIRSNSGAGNIKAKMKLRSGVDINSIKFHVVQFTNALTGEDRGTINLMLGAPATACSPGYACIEASLNLIGRIKVSLRSGADLLPLSTVFESIEFSSITRPGKSIVVPWDRNKVMTSFLLDVTP